MNGFITIDKKIIEWEWYRSINEKILFIHLLITCNYEDKKWREFSVKRGQIITSYSKLSAQTGLSMQSIRSALTNMQKTGEVTCKSTNRFTIITICKYDSYQKKNTTANKQSNTVTNKQSNKQSNTPTNNDINNINKKNKEIITTPPFKGLGVDSKLWCDNVEYFSSQADPECKLAKKIYDFYKKQDFIINGKPIDRYNYDVAIQSYLNSKR